MLPHDEQQRYVVGLDVFHVLHCVNMIRKLLHPEYYSESDMKDINQSHDDFNHIDHCIEYLRQSVTCSVDLTPIPFQWNDAQKLYKPSITGMHTCRNFEVVREWAKERAVVKDWDPTYRAVNDPLDPDTWTLGFNP
ncbi:hypothetical protein F5X96DRAFT_647060 [Biscogniauxia mediterranea]|nr:hypothetical protein F5X96DRAFT_647060 [Biscogniauxia mediterranea]